MKKEKILLAESKENTQRGIKVKRTENQLNEKEIELFKIVYPITPNRELAKQFMLKEDAVERLAHNLKIYKDPAFLKVQQARKIGDTGRITETGEKATPPYLIREIAKQMTDEEEREFLNSYYEGVEAEEMLEELAMVQAVRVKRGIIYENKQKSLFRVVNEAVDSLHSILKTLYEMKHGKKVKHELTFEKIILDSQDELFD
jgi:hypothetical protein